MTNEQAAKPKEIRRALFERGIEALRRTRNADFPLAPMTINGEFHHYIDSDTDSAWIGFQLACNVLKNLENSEEPTTQSVAWTVVRKENLPDRFVPVLVATRDGIVKESNGSAVRELFFAAQRDNEECYFTHWQPMLPHPDALCRLLNNNYQINNHET